MLRRRGPAGSARAARQLPWEAHAEEQPFPRQGAAAGLHSTGVVLAFQSGGSHALGPLRPDVRSSLGAVDGVRHGVLAHALP
eukprot:4349859-Pyramimonas_sp.AAC.1